MPAARRLAEITRGWDIASGREAVHALRDEFALLNEEGGIYVQDMNAWLDTISDLLDTL